MSDVSTPTRRRWRPRRALIQSVILALPIVGFLVFAFLQAQADGGAAQTWQYVATIGAVSVVLFFVFSLFGALRTGVFKREKALRKLGNPHWMEESFTTQQLRQIIAIVDNPESTSIPTEPIWVTISMDSDGITIWGGGDDVTEYVSLPWRQLDNPGPAFIVDYPKRSRGFGIDVTTDDGRRYRLAIPLLGRGMFGTAQAYPEDISELISIIRSRTVAKEPGSGPSKESNDGSQSDR